MQDKNTTKSTFFQLFGPILSQDLWRTISRKVESVDKYVKKLKTVQLVQLVINAEMKEYTSLAEISNSLNEDAFAEAIRLESISTSQISRRFREMTTDFADIIHKSVVQMLGVELGYKAPEQDLMTWERRMLPLIQRNGAYLSGKHQGGLIPCYEASYI